MAGEQPSRLATVSAWCVVVVIQPGRMARRRAPTAHQDADRATDQQPGGKARHHGIRHLVKHFLDAGTGLFRGERPEFFRRGQRRRPGDFRAFDGTRRGLRRVWRMMTRRPAAMIAPGVRVMGGGMAFAHSESLTG